MKKSILYLFILCSLSSCSVMMAAKKEGISVTKIQSCHCRAQIIASGAIPVDSKYLPSGELVEIYQIQQKRGSAARAFMHGVLDVGTCGLWEVVGTPIEAYTEDKEYYFIRATYDEQD